MNTLSCIARVKRTSENEFNRPPDFPQYVFATFTGDRSGSMRDMVSREKNIPAEGLYEFITSQCKNALLNNQDSFISVTTFDEKNETVIDNTESKNINVSMANCTEWMQPRGSTKLYDTAIGCLNKQKKNANEFMESLPAHIRRLNPKVVKIWALMTDGYDNASFSSSRDLRKTVELAREDGTICYFLAANMDAQEVGESFGFSADNSLTFDADIQHAPCALRSVTANMLRTASNGSAAPFTQCQRQESQNHNAIRFVSAPTNSIMGAINTPLPSTRLNLRAPPLPSRRNLRTAPLAPQ